MVEKVNNFELIISIICLLLIYTKYPNLYISKKKASMCFLKYFVTAYQLKISIKLYQKFPFSYQKRKFISFIV